MPIQPLSDLAGVLLDELERLEARFSTDELAFLALTSKVELPARDRLAFGLANRLPEILVAREWRRIDLALLSGSGDPKLLLDAKALYTFDLVGEAAWVARYPAKIRGDLEKLRTLRLGSAELFGLVLATHPRVPILGKCVHIAKYAAGVNRAIALLDNASAVAEAASVTLQQHVAPLGAVYSGRINGGVAYDIPVDVLYWLVGPISHFNAI